jgi:sugar-specific transcriptional regulator TrmB
MLRDRDDVIRRLGTEAGLTRSEAELYLKLLGDGYLPLSSRGGDLEKLESEGMLILSGDGKKYVPVHPRLAIANHYRTWRERMVREINDRRMSVDRLILELIPVYEAATDKRLGLKGGKEGHD